MPLTMVPKMQIVKTFQERIGSLCISKVIKEINDDKSYTLDLPIVIVGYSKMRRGISFRSKKRVPTHILESLGQGHNMMNVMQTMERALMYIKF